MKGARIWTFQSLLTCFFWNGILVTVLFLTANWMLQGIHLWMDSFSQSGAPSLSEDVRPAFDHLRNFVNEIERYLAPAIFGFGSIVTFLLWLFLLFEGRGFARRAQAERVTHFAEREEAKETAAQESQYVQASPQPAVQMLSILQREGRLVDFLKEDLSHYEDAQIGAAVRNIHQGCKEALSEYVDLKPVYEQDEGVEITVPPDFDSRAIRLTGNVSGNPPFKGVLRHRGWRAVRVQLPRPTSEQKEDWIVAPAEVEVNG